MSVVGRTLVVHGDSGKIGCGLILPMAGEVALIGSYPGYEGSLSVSGLLALNATDAGALRPPLLAARTVPSRVLIRARRRTAAPIAADANANANHAAGALLPAQG